MIPQESVLSKQMKTERVAKAISWAYIITNVLIFFAGIIDANSRQTLSNFFLGMAAIDLLPTTLSLANYYRRVSAKTT